MTSTTQAAEIAVAAGQGTIDPCGRPCTIERVSSYRDCGQRVTRVWARYEDGTSTAFYSQRHPGEAAS